ncbi:MAG: ATP-binding cassette domain-containing protein, partial [SAR324 cluster bacterium]|nr:ATP-binding cassette domain-containing protein [SAR324 cluster bacterium]
PNGAGKSTTMKMLSCFITPTSGTARVGGKDILTDSIEVRKIVGYLPESAPSYKSMTVSEFLHFIAETRGFSGQEKSQKVARIIDLTTLNSARYQTIDTLSKGYRQRVGFAQALIHDPPVLILDEPTDGLDPNQKQEVRALIGKMAEEKAIILSTHILEEMEAVCNRAIIINQGKIVADGPPQTLLTHSKMYNTVTLTLPRQLEDATVQSLRELEDVSDVKMSAPSAGSYTVQIFPKKKQDILGQVKSCLDAGSIEISEIYREKGFMDEVFRNLTLGE